MGGGGSIAGMIVSLRNNNSLRLGRKHFFTKERRESDSGEIKSKPAKHTKRSPEQILQFREELKKQRRNDLILKFVAFAIALGITSVALYFLYTFLT